jgi:hypothetical protein
MLYSLLLYSLNPRVVLALATPPPQLNFLQIAPSVTLAPWILLGKGNLS